MLFERCDVDGVSDTLVNTVSRAGFALFGCSQLICNLIKDLFVPFQVLKSVYFSRCMMITSQQYVPLKAC